MTLSRLISLPLHAALELAAGTALMVAPFVFDFGSAGMVTAVVVGAGLVGLALTLGETGERGALPLNAHHAYDSGVVLGLAICSIALGIAGDTNASAVFAVAALVQMLLTTNTRYSSPVRA